jgi:hypothetical protein
MKIENYEPAANINQNDCSINELLY